MLKSMSPNASGVVQPCIRELVALCGDGSWLVVVVGVFLGGFCKYFPLLFLMTDTKNTLSSVLFTFTLGSCCVFSLMRTNCSGLSRMCR